MGAYLSQPKTEKVSTDEFNTFLTVGASSMQGWRNSQEDAHNCILSYDENTSFFAVYDGHGGAEVATYCADKLPEFLKGLDAYKINDFEKALKDGFLGFDKTLLEPKTIENLKILADEKNFVECCDDGDEDEEDACMEDLAELREESNLPLDEVLEKYKTGNVREDFLKKIKDSNGSKPQSPFLRGRRAAAVAADAANKAVMDPDAKPQGSSTSAAAAAAALNDAGPSSSKSGTSKMDTDEPEEDSTVSSSSSSASKTNSSNNAASIEANKNENSSVAVAATTVTATAADTEANITTNGADALTTTSTSAKLKAADSSHVKEIEQNGSVTSSQAKPTKGDVSTSAATDDATVSGSNDAAKKIQNGTVGSSSATSSSANASKNAANIERSAISSTSKEAKNAKKDAAIGEEDSTDDDYDADSADENDANNELEYSSEEDLEEDSDGEGEEDEEIDTEEEEEEIEEDEDEAIANEEFCANMIEEPGKDSGCTAVVALLKGRDLYVANAGDSRCVVCRNGKAIDMSLDHKPEDDEESARIVKAGGRVTLDGRVNGGLNLSRAIGDHAYKMNLLLSAEEQMISALPDIKKLIITPDDEFMILACDGIWNYMSSDDVVHFVRLRLKDESKKISEICEELFDTCLAPNTMGDGTGCDNMTAVIIRFKPKLLELPTIINPNETEDVLSQKQATTQGNVDGACSQKSLKRSASPTSDDNSNETEENANKTKRLKTDQDLSSSTNTTNTNNSSNTITTSNNKAISSNDAASSTDKTSPDVTATTNEQKECDTVSNEAALSST